MLASAQTRRILIVAQSSERVGAVGAAMLRCRQAHRCRFTLLVPAVAHGLHRVFDPEDQCCAEAERRLLAAHAGRLARWARIDLASKVRALGVMVTLVPSAG
jgi:hypothetical protein